jgi:hypothetical protein
MENRPIRLGEAERMYLPSIVHSPSLSPFPQYFKEQGANAPQPSKHTTMCWEYNTKLA